MRGMKRVKTSKGLLLQSKQLLMRGAWARKASAFGDAEREREAFCQVTRLPAWLGNEWGEEPDKTLPAPYLRWIAEMCRIGTPYSPRARLPWGYRNECVCGCVVTSESGGGTCRW